MRQRPDTNLTPDGAKSPAEHLQTRLELAETRLPKHIGMKWFTCLLNAQIQSEEPAAISQSAKMVHILEEVGKITNPRTQRIIADIVTEPSKLFHITRLKNLGSDKGKCAAIILQRIEIATNFNEQSTLYAALAVISPSQFTTAVETLSPQKIQMIVSAVGVANPEAVRALKLSTSMTVQKAARKADVLSNSLVLTLQKNPLKFWEQLQTLVPQRATDLLILTPITYAKAVRTALSTSDRQGANRAREFILERFSN